MRKKRQMKSQRHSDCYRNMNDLHPVLMRVHGEKKGVHEILKQDRVPVSMRGTWRIEGGT